MQKKWTDEKLISEIKRVMELLNILDRLPTVRDMQKHSPCYDSIAKSGGMKRLAEMVRLPVAGDVIVYEKACAICGKPFTSRYRSTRCCSKTCRNKLCLIEKQKPKPEKESRAREIMTMKDVRRSKAFEKEQAARENGMHYADLQKAKTLEMVGGIQL